MKTLKAVVFALAACLAACGGSPSAGPTSANDAPRAQAVKPESGAARAHFDKHVTYPASRSVILAACSKTTEFTEAEKAWFEQHLPDKEYASSAEVIAALGL